jgi:hypothetical protein
MHLLFLLLALATAPYRPAAVPGPHEIFGVIRHVGPTTIIVARRNGTLLLVDITYARAVGRTGVLYVKRGVGVYGNFDPSAHLYRANAIINANGIERGIWPADR